MALDLLVATGMWAMIFIPGSIVGGMAAKFKDKDSDFMPGVLSQVVFIVLSLIILLYCGKLNELWSINSAGYLFQAILLSIILSIIISIKSIKLVNEDYNPPFIPRNIVEAALIAGILAPLGEELMYRGVVESYLLIHENLIIAIIYPSILFSLMHIAPFYSSPKTYLIIVLTGAFILGLLAGYYRGVSGSLIPAIATHSTVNIMGYIIYNLNNNFSISKQITIINNN